MTPFMKHFYVFNIDQTDFKEKYPERYEGMRVRFSGPAVADNVKGNRNPWLDKMIKEQKWLCPIELKVQDRAYYSPSKDRIVLPTPGQFKDMESFQMTALHEMAHSTGHSSRLDRGLHHPFGTCGYAREEIIAEFTAAVTGRDLGIAVTPRKENAQYLKSWLSNLKEDPGYVMSVLREAGKASAMIEESVEKQHTLADTSAREEDISPLPIKKKETTKRSLPAFSICITARKNNIRMQWPLSVWGMNTRHIIRMRKDSMRYLAYAQGKRCRKKTARRS